jgi:hypothetical protein
MNLCRVGHFLNEVSELLPGEGKLIFTHQFGPPLNLFPAQVERLFMTAG